MAKNDDVVQKIGNLIDQKLEPVKNDLQAVKHGQKQLEIEQTLTNNTIAKLEQGQSRLEQGQELLQQGLVQTNASLAQTNTALGQIKTLVEAVAAGQEDIRKQLATKADRADIQDLGAKLDKYQKKNEQRFENIEEHTGASNPHKN